MDNCMCTNCIRTRNTGGWSPCENYKPCGEVLPPVSVGTPMPKCKPPKQEANITEYKALKKMLTYFKEEHAKSNQALQESGDSAYCSPFDTISVSELKDYMLNVLEEELNL